MNRSLPLDPLKALLLPLAAMLSMPLHAQVAINTNGAPPAGNAMLDIQSLTRGLLVPRVNNLGRSGMTMAGVPNGMIVYQTDSVTSNPKGFYYYDASTPPVGWRHLPFERAWKLGGNAGTTTNDFIGTINNKPLVFRISDQDRGRITETGLLQLYAGSYPAGSFNQETSSIQSELVYVQGAVKLSGNATVMPPAGSNINAGTIVFVPPTGGTPGSFQGYVHNTGTGAVDGWRQLDNNFYERKYQQRSTQEGGCADPSSSTDVTTTPRPWPIPGPISGFGTFSASSASSPYFTLWEDSRRQYLFLSSDLNAAGICPGPSNPIRAIAFYATTPGSGSGRIHFLRISMKNTTMANTNTFDDNGLQLFSLPGFPTNGVGYTDGNLHNQGYQVGSGWNIHAPDANTGNANFVWSGQNLLLDAAIDNQEWNAPSIRNAGVQSYSTNYISMITSYCDACGHSTGGSCLWSTAPPAGYTYPPTNPTNGFQGTNANAVGWGYVGGWFLTNNTNTITCDGTYGYTGGGSPTRTQALPRVAFLAKYIGGGMAMDVGSYITANEGLMVGSAAWATAPGNYRGPGTLNAQRSVYSDNTLLTDYVFDLYYDGKAKPEDAKGANNYQRVPLKELPNYVERERRLPNVDGREAWQRNGPASLDQLTNQLWIAVEDQALYIQELNQRADALRQYLLDKKLKELEGR